MSDNVNHPQHYQHPNPAYEAIKVIEAWCLGFCLGNAVKYIMRAPHKGREIEDLEKARWYLDRHIAAKKREAEAIAKLDAMVARRRGARKKA